MQVFPKTAGRDVFKLVKTALANPAPSICLTQKTTLIPVRPILHPENRYLKEVRHPKSLEYSMISAYNGGTGGVLSTFSRDRQRAMRDLNARQPNQVYWALTKTSECGSASLSGKVTKFKKEFNAG